MGGSWGDWQSDWQASRRIGRQRWLQEEREEVVGCSVEGPIRQQRRQAKKSEVESRRMNDQDEGEKLFRSSM